MRKSVENGINFFNDIKTKFYKRKCDIDKSFKSLEKSTQMAFLITVLTVFVLHGYYFLHVMLSVVLAFISFVILEHLFEKTFKVIDKS